MNGEEKSLVLIVDDNPQNIWLLGKIIRDSGYNLGMAKTGIEALTFIQKRAPDIILLDIMMPEMDGFETCKKLKENPVTKDIPVLFITALTETENKLKAFAVGGEDYITKPFVKEEVLARVKMVLARRISEKALQESELKYSSVVENSTDAIIIIQDNKLKFVNRAMIKMIGFTPEEALEHDFLQWVAPVDREKATQQNEARISGKAIPNISEMTLLRKGGITFPVEINGNLIAYNKKPANLVFIRDITERKRVENLKQDVERIVRHDLKNPLNGIIGLTSLLLMESFSTENKTMLNYIKESGHKILRMIDHSLDIYKMENRTYSFSPELFNAIRMFKEIDQELTSYTKKVIFLLRGTPLTWNENFFIQGEESYLKTLFSNLIVNALEASPDGGKVTVDITTNEEEYRFDIHNQGVIPEEIQERFFDRYATFGKKGGTGLGTHSALLIAKTHGGNIQYTTSPEEGTHLVVFLPKKNSFSE